jgi:leader peptidase (prepilin peptidase)/N-methyltransferase
MSEQILNQMCIKIINFVLFKKRLLEKMIDMWKWLSIAALFLALEDWQKCTFQTWHFLLYLLPMIIWPPHFSYLMLGLIALGILAEYKNIGMGAGDFYLLAWWSGYCSIFELLKIVMIASFCGIFLGIIFFKRKVIPFIPCLAVGLILIHFFKIL